MKRLIVLALVAFAVVKGGVVPSDGAADSGTADGMAPEPESYREKMCKQYGGEGAYARAVRAESEFARCMEDVKQNMSRESLEEAIVNNNLPDLLKTYCSRSQDAKYCLSNFTYGLGGCMQPEQRKLLEFAYNRVIPDVIDYVCWEDGRRMVAFLTAGGRDCWVSKKSALKQCAPGDNLHEGLEEWALREMEATPENCRSTREARDCIVHLMQSCPDPTPAQEIEGLLNHVHGNMPCTTLSQVDTNT